MRRRSNLWVPFLLAASALGVRAGFANCVSDEVSREIKANSQTQSEERGDSLYEDALRASRPDMDSISRLLDQKPKRVRKAFEKQMKSVAKDLQKRGYVSADRLASLARQILLASIDERSLREKLTGTPDADTWIERRVRYDLIETKLLEAFERQGKLDPSYETTQKKWRLSWPKFKRSVFKIGFNLLFLSTVHQPYLQPSSWVRGPKLPPELLAAIERDGFEPHRAELRERLGRPAKFDVAYNSTLKLVNTLLLARMGIWAIQTLPGNALALYQQSRLTDEDCDEAQKKTFKPDPIRQEALKRWKEGFEMVNGKPPSKAETDAYIEESGIMDPKRVTDEQLKVDYSFDGK